MHRQHSTPSAGQRLTTQYPIARFYAQFTLGTNVLLQRDDKLLWQGNLAQWRRVRLAFHFWRMNTTVEIPDFVFSECGE